MRSRLFQPLPLLLIALFATSHLALGSSTSAAHATSIQAVTSCLTGSFEKNLQPEPLAQPEADTLKLEDEDVLSLIATLKKTKSLKLIPTDALPALRARAGVETNEQLLQPEILDDVVKKIQVELGDDRFSEAVGKHLATWKEVLGPTKPEDRDHPENGLLNGNQDYGSKLLPDHDKAFFDPKYLSKTLRASNASGVGQYTHGDKTILPAFQEAWKELAPNHVLPPAVFFQSGSDANNYLYEIADATYANKTDQKYSSGTTDILIFKGSYGGAWGRMHELSDFGGTRKDLLITSPTTTSLRPTDRAEILRLQELEDQAVDEIRAAVKRGGKDSRPVGGIMIEPFLGWGGGLYYRPEFMLRLRALCDKLEIPLIADEVLTAGGRTGKFFAWQYYPGFEPDLITIGKGFQFGAVTQVERDRRWKLEIPKKQTTFEAYPEALLKATQILNRIRIDHLMENAAITGQYLMKRFIENEPQRLRDNIARYQKMLTEKKAEHERKIAKYQNRLQNAASRNERRDIENEIMLENLLYSTSFETDQLQKAEAKLASLKSGQKPTYIRGTGLFFYGPESSIAGAVSRGEGMRYLFPLTLTPQDVDKMFPANQ